METTQTPSTGDQINKLSHPHNGTGLGARSNRLSIHATMWMNLTQQFMHMYTWAHTYIHT